MKNDTDLKKLFSKTVFHSVELGSSLGYGIKSIKDDITNYNNAKKQLIPTTKLRFKSAKSFLDSDKRSTEEHNNEQYRIMKHNTRMCIIHSAITILGVVDGLVGLSKNIKKVDKIINQPSKMYLIEEDEIIF